MTGLKRFYWVVALLGLGFFLFFWGSTPQEAQNYKPLRTTRPDFVVAPAAVSTPTDAPGSNASVTHPVVGTRTPVLDNASPHVWFEPAEPKPGDQIRIAVADGVDPASLTIHWTHGQLPITGATQALSLTLDARIFRKTHTVHAYVEGSGWREELVARLANRAPELAGFSQPRHYGNVHLIEVEGTDPDADNIWLKLPANVPGVQARGMNLEFDLSVVTEVRSIPVILTDGADDTAFLYVVRPDHFK